MSPGSQSRVRQGMVPSRGDSAQMEGHCFQRQGKRRLERGGSRAREKSKGKRRTTHQHGEHMSRILHYWKQRTHAWRMSLSFRFSFRCWPSGGQAVWPSWLGSSAGEVALACSSLVWFFFFAPSHHLDILATHNIHAITISSDSVWR